MPIAPAGGINDQDPHGVRDAGIPPTESGEGPEAPYDTHMMPLYPAPGGTSNDKNKPR